MRVATLNLWCRNGSWPDRRCVLIDGFRELRPDLVAFQESIKTSEYDQVVDLLGPAYTVFHQSGRTPHDGAGASIASRWPVRHVHELDLTVTPRVDPAEPWIGSVAVAEVEAPDPIGPVLFVNHKPSWQYGLEYERELQAVATARLIEGLMAHSRRHVVLAGDFDAVPEAASIRFWSGLQSLDSMSVCYRDAWESVHRGEPGHTFTPRNPLVNIGEMTMELGRRIDYIFVRSGKHQPTLAVDRCELIFNEPVDGVWASDHFGVLADLTAV